MACKQQLLAFLDRIGCVLIMCLVSPFYACFLISSARKKAASERERRELMTPVLGLTTTARRRRLSITPSMLEKGQSSQFGADIKQEKTGFGRLLSNLPGTSAIRVLSSSSSPSRQEESRFLTRLPLEIRLTIYQYALSTQRVHVVTIPGKVASVACSEGTREGFVCYNGNKHDYQCPPAHVYRPTTRAGCVIRELSVAPVKFLPSAKKGISGALDLLCVCRQVYTEAVTVLYKNMTFQMDLLTLLGFSISIPDHHLKRITKLEISGPHLDYLDSYCYLNNLPYFRRIRRPGAHPSIQHQHTADNINDSSNDIPTPAPKSIPKFYTPTHDACFYSRSAFGDFTIYSPRPPTGWEVACSEVLPHLTSLCELKISLKRPSAFSEKCMSRATERYMLRPLCQLKLQLPRLHVFEVRVDWQEGLEGQMWSDAWEWPHETGEEQGQGQGQGQGHDLVRDGVMMTAMWRPNVFLWEEVEKVELIRDGREVGMDERWNSYLGGVDESGDGDGEGLWDGAPFKLIRTV
ncbi:hypothetical protein PAAG_08079 [Paracoccidioides lutzii Pb01]|uniref:DUF7730 domain-containing protein n=1 Tax=Paracoccidioides lutzii (strain ATCC MYA-826 / Pb01) TaxID=502779 RepID=C1HBD8_PARBA|nr:hypothetical protein PAAG_08079 [Paracoccidioides lutzii Pb01]EEH37661.1 hypothetical protein PAAG_08079 [Paracoccidioides lutzii Pb01]